MVSMEATWKPARSYDSARMPRTPHSLVGAKPSRPCWPASRRSSYENTISTVASDAQRKRRWFRKVVSGSAIPRNKEPQGKMTLTRFATPESSATRISVGSVMQSRFGTPPRLGLRDARAAVSDNVSGFRSVAINSQSAACLAQRYGPQASPLPRSRCTRPRYDSSSDQI